MTVPDAAKRELEATLDKYEADLTAQLIAAGRQAKRPNYRKIAFAHYAEKHGQIVARIAALASMMSSKQPISMAIEAITTLQTSQFYVQIATKCTISI